MKGLHFSTTAEELGIVDKSSSPSFGSIIRYALIFMLIAVLCGAITVLGIGIYTHEVEYGSKQVSGLLGVDMYQVDSLMMVVSGSVAIFVSALGLFGVCLRHRCTLGLHLSILAFLAIMVFVAGILGYVFISELEQTVKQAMKDTITKKYGIINSMTDFSSITSSWNAAQQRFGCCGAYGNENSTTSWAIYRESFWFKDKYSNGTYVPESCCWGNNKLLCTGAIASNGPPTVPPPVLHKPTNYTLYMTGCYDKLHSFLTDNGILIGTAAIVVGVFMLNHNKAYGSNHKLIEMVLGICVWRMMKT